MFCAAEGIQVYSTMSETEAAFTKAEYNTIIEKFSLALHGGFWIQVYTQTTSIYQYLKL